MGCDIHGPFIEARLYPENDNHGDIWRGIAEMNGSRDYALFGLLAGVRGGEAVVSVKHEWPNGIDYHAHDHREADRGDCHHRSWVTLAEMRVVAEAYHAQVGGWSDADMMVAMMDDYEQGTGCPTRALFCFDN